MRTVASRPAYRVRCPPMVCRALRSVQSENGERLYEVPPREIGVFKIRFVAITLKGKARNIGAIS